MPDIRRLLAAAIDAVVYMDPIVSLVLLIGGIILVVFGIRISRTAGDRSFKDTLIVLTGMAMTAVGLVPWIVKLTGFVPTLPRVE